MWPSLADLFPLLCKYYTNNFLEQNWIYQDRQSLELLLVELAVQAAPCLRLAYSCYLTQLGVRVPPLAMPCNLLNRTAPLSRKPEC